MRNLTIITLALLSAVAISAGSLFGALSSDDDGTPVEIMNAFRDSTNFGEVEALNQALDFDEIELTDAEVQDAMNDAGAGVAFQAGGPTYTYPKFRIAKNGFGATADVIVEVCKQDGQIISGKPKITPIFNGTHPTSAMDAVIDQNGNLTVNLTWTLSWIFFDTNHGLTREIQLGCP